VQPFAPIASQKEEIMNIQAILHIPKSNYCYAYTRDNIHIRIRTAKDDLDKVNLVYGDKYQWDKCITEEMKCSYSDELFDYYTIEVEAPNYRLSYYFELVSEGETHPFTEWGILPELVQSEMHMVMFHYPYINEIDIHKTPEWVKDSVFYQIFPDRFANGNEAINPPNIAPWDSKPEYTSFFGGNLEGIIEHLDHIESLGVNVVYMTPIFKSTTNHKYDTTDYYQIDPHFGDKETLKRLVDECHKRGMKILLDAVFNHCGYKFPKFQDVMEKGADSEYAHWFQFYQKDGSGEMDYERFGFEKKMPKLNVSNDEVKKYFLEVAKYWIKEVDIDGWRLDVSNEVCHEFWRDFRKEVKSIKSDAYLVGENWHDSLPWLNGDQFDSIMNYPVTYTCRKYFAEDVVNTSKFKEMINTSLMRNTWQVNEAMLNLLDSHDTPRFVNQCGLNFKKSLLGMGFLMTFVGAVSVYYGTEIGMTGEQDPDCRRGMEWNKENWNMDVLNRVKLLIAIRNDNIALRRGDFQWIDAKNDILAYKRVYKNEQILVFLNNSSETKQCNIEHGEYTDLVSREKIVTNAQQNTLFISEYDIRILLKNK